MPRVRLRAVTETDLPAFFAQQCDEASWRMAAFAPRDHDAFFAHWKRILADETGVVRTVIADERPVGHVIAFDRDGVREVGYWIERASWGRGIASRALALLLELDRTRPLHARVAAHNAGSIRVLEKCGFETIERRTVPADERGPEVDERLMVLR